MINTSNMISNLIEASTYENSTEESMFEIEILIKQSENSGFPIKIDEIYNMAAQFIISEKLGWYERYKFKSNLYFDLLNIFGFKRQTAQHHIFAIDNLVKSKR